MVSTCSDLSQGRTVLTVGIVKHKTKYMVEQNKKDAKSANIICGMLTFLLLFSFIFGLTRESREPRRGR